MVEKCLQVGGERVVVETGGRLAGRAETAPVVADAAVARIEQHALLALPRVAVERVAVDEHDRLAGPVIVEVDLDVGAVLFPDSHEGHGDPYGEVVCRQAGSDVRPSLVQRRFHVYRPGGQNVNDLRLSRLRRSVHRQPALVVLGPQANGAVVEATLRDGAAKSHGSVLRRTSRAAAAVTSAAAAAVRRSGRPGQRKPPRTRRSARRGRRSRAAPVPRRAAERRRSRGIGTLRHAAPPFDQDETEHHDQQWGDEEEELVAQLGVRGDGRRTGQVVFQPLAGAGGERHRDRRERGQRHDRPSPAPGRRARGRRPVRRGRRRGSGPRPRARRAGAVGDPDTNVGTVPIMAADCQSFLGGGSNTTMMDGRECRGQRGRLPRCRSGPGTDTRSAGSSEERIMHPLVTTTRLTLRDWSADDAAAALGDLRRRSGRPLADSGDGPHLRPRAMRSVLQTWQQEQPELLPPQGRWAIHRTPTRRSSAASASGSSPRTARTSS